MAVNWRCCTYRCTNPLAKPSVCEPLQASPLVLQGTHPLGQGGYVSRWWCSKFKMDVLDTFYMN